MGKLVSPKRKKIARRKMVVRQLHDTNAAKTLSFHVKKGLARVIGARMITLER
jgi:hypothetical protein